MFKNKYFWVAIFWTITITILSLTSSNNVPKVRIPNIDKIVHFIFYFFFTIFWYLSFKGSDSNKINKKMLCITSIVAFFYGILMEIFQELYTLNRTGDIKDVVANTIGVLVAIFLIIRYYSRNKTKQYSKSDFHE